MLYRLEYHGTVAAYNTPVIARFTKCMGHLHILRAHSKTRRSTNDDSPITNDDSPMEGVRRLGRLLQDLPQLLHPRLSSAPRFIEQLAPALTHDTAESLLPDSSRSALLVQRNRDCRGEEGLLERRRVREEVRSAVSSCTKSKLVDTHDSNTPKDAHSGIRPRGRGCVSSLSQMVWNVVSSYFALGRRAAVSLRPTECQLLTIPQRGHDGQHGGVVGVSVVVNAHHVDVDYPGGLAWSND